MSSITGLFGIGGGGPTNNAKFQAQGFQNGEKPQNTTLNAAQGDTQKLQGADIQMPVNVGQANQAYDQNQNAVAQQQQLANALANQGGIGNQSSVFNQLQGVASGQGPNPAQAMLNQATGANTANQAALMAGQRGAGANAGLMARQAAQQGGANQQNAAGQAATMQANQSLGALNQMGGIAGQQVGQQMGAVQGLNTNAQNNQQILLNAINAQNQANIANQAQLNQANVAQQSNLNNFNLGMQENLNNSNVAMQSNINNANAGMSENQNNANAGMAQANANNQAKAQSGLLGGALGGLGGMAASLIPGGTVAAGVLGAGGTVAKYKGGEIKSPNPKIAAVSPSNRYEGAMAMPEHLLGIHEIYHGEKYSQGGEVNAMVSPGEIYLPKDKAKQVARGEDSPMEGEKIPGKAKVRGDSKKNDIVPKKLEEGGVVIPRSVLDSEDPEGNASKFVAKHLGKKKEGNDSDFKEALRRAIAGRKSK